MSGGTGIEERRQEGEGSTAGEQRWVRQTSWPQPTVPGPVRQWQEEGPRPARARSPRHPPLVPAVLAQCLTVSPLPSPQGEVTGSCELTGLSEGPSLVAWPV